MIYRLCNEEWHHCRMPPKSITAFCIHSKHFIWCNGIITLNCTSYVFLWTFHNHSNYNHTNYHNHKCKNSPQPRIWYIHNHATELIENVVQYGTFTPTLITTTTKVKFDQEHRSMHTCNTQKNTSNQPPHSVIIVHNEYSHHNKKVT